MINWYFSNRDKTIWLSTSANTRAENFYKMAGWEQTGIQSNGELRFELTAKRWEEKNRVNN